jgi:hypothetical protein
VPLLDAGRNTGGARVVLRALSALIEENTLRHAIHVASQ